MEERWLNWKVKIRTDHQYRSQGRVGVCCASDCSSAPWRSRGPDEAAESSTTPAASASRRCSTRWRSGEGEAPPGNGSGAWARRPCGCTFGWRWWTSAARPPWRRHHHHRGGPGRDGPSGTSSCSALPRHRCLRGPPRQGAAEPWGLRRPGAAAGSATGGGLAWAPRSIGGTCSPRRAHGTVYARVLTARGRVFNTLPTQIINLK